MFRDVHWAEGAEKGHKVFGARVGRLGPRQDARLITTAVRSSDCGTPRVYPLDGPAPSKQRRGGILTGEESRGPARYATA